MDVTKAFSARGESVRALEPTPCYLAALRDTTPRAECMETALDHAAPALAASNGVREPLIVGECNRTAQFGEALATLW